MEESCIESIFLRSARFSKHVVQFSHSQSSYLSYPNFFFFFDRGKQMRKESGLQLTKSSERSLVWGMGEETRFQSVCDHNIKILFKIIPRKQRKLN